MNICLKQPSLLISTGNRQYSLAKMRLFTTGLRIGHFYFKGNKNPYDTYVCLKMARETQVSPSIAAVVSVLMSRIINKVLACYGPSGALHALFFKKIFDRVYRLFYLLSEVRTANRIAVV